jgi:hypothetical protein
VTATTARTDSASTAHTSPQEKHLGPHWILRGARSLAGLSGLLAPPDPVRDGVDREPDGSTPERSFSPRPPVQFDRSPREKSTPGEKDLTYTTPGMFLAYDRYPWYRCPPWGSVLSPCSQLR